jgi:hypothetical protein
VKPGLLKQVGRYALGLLGVGLIALSLRSMADPSPPNGRLAAVSDGLLGAVLTYAMTRTALTGKVQWPLPRDDGE